uniref:triple tyrosine motif-containing protein n=1 Tax=Nostoc sp. CMAA1605 TaxID=2055159 RepID=UPI001F8ED837
GYGSGDQQVRSGSLPYKWNALHFAFATSLMAGQPEAEFSYYLEGFDQRWSNWSTQHEKDYTNLPEGSYVFHVKSRSSPSAESPECTYTFRVAPPWYRSWWAYVIYLLLVSAAFYGVYRLQDRRLRRKQEQRRQADQQQFEEEQRRLTYQHQLEMARAEKEMIKLKNENLEAEIEHKNAELASTAMNLVQKKEFMLKITGELNKLCKPGNDQVDTAELKKIIRSLGSEEKLDEDWKQFSIHFNSVHSNFLINLKKAFPALNAHELKLCAYLRMNLSSKEIAQLLSISVRGVEISRYRLRKKLQVPAKEDLFQFLLQVEAKENPGSADQPDTPVS